MDFLRHLIDRAELLAAGGLGAFVGGLLHRDDMANWRAWAIFLITGVACALYLTSIVSGFLGVAEPDKVAGVGFLLGAFGGSIMTAISRAIKTADIWALIRSRFGGGSQ